MASQRKGESTEDFKARRSAYNRDWSAANPGYKRQWSTIRRTKDAKGKVVGRIQIPVTDSPLVHPLNPSLARVSTLYDSEGKMRAQWQVERPADRARALWMEEALEVLSQRLEPIELPTPAVVGVAYRNEMVGYPIGDQHLGMLAWRPETGASYDLDIGERLLRKAFADLVDRAPAAEDALIAVLGDFLHYDSVVPVTTKGRNILDTDTRQRKMIRVALRCLVGAIETALTKHKYVRIIVAPGNHDEGSAGWMSEALQLRYSEDLRVTVDTTPGRFHYCKFGKVLIGVTHGDTAQAPGVLPGIMANDRAEDWGQTRHRMWWTGHVHKQQLWSMAGCTVESFNVLPPADAWATAAGYRTHRELHALILNQETGYRGRLVVTPEMVGE